MTVYRAEGFRIVIYSNDQEPRHVHVIKDGGEVKVSLDGDLGMPVPVLARGMSRRDVARALRIVMEQQASLIAEWERIHG